MVREAVENLLRVYGHADLVALTKIDALYSDATSDAKGAETR